MNKGQVGIALMVVIGVIGLVVVNSMTEPFCNCTPTTTNKTLYVGEWNNESCDGEKCDAEPWGVYCNSSELEAGVNYTIEDCNVYLDDATWNDTNCMLYYEYGTTYYDTGLLGMVVCNIPILFAVGLMVLAVGWAALR